jgi:hypothetical protein
LNISGSIEVPWDSVEIKQTVKEKPSEINEQDEEASVKTEGDAVLTTDEKDSVNGDQIAKKKSRRRPRHKKRRPVDTIQEVSPEASITPERSLIEPAPAGENLPAIQDHHEEHSPLIIEPAKEQVKVEESVVGQEPDKPVSHIIETEKKDEE